MASNPKYPTRKQRRHALASRTGLPDLHADWFVDAGVTDLDQMIYLAANGVDGHSALSFTRAGITDPSQMLHLTANGVIGYNASRFSRAGVTDPDQMISLAKLKPCPVDSNRDLNRIRAARARAGNEIVDRVLSAGVRIGRFPNGTLIGLSRSAKIAAELTELSDEALDVSVTLVEDQFDTTGKVTIGLIRETLNIIH